MIYFYVKKAYIVQITFHAQRRSARDAGDRPCSRRLKITSTVERERSGWRRKVARFYAHRSVTVTKEEKLSA